MASAWLSSRRSLGNARGDSGPLKGTRVPLSFAHKRFDGKVPEPGNPSRFSAKGLDSEDRELPEKVETGFETVGELYNACNLRVAPSVPSGQAWARAV